MVLKYQYCKCKLDTDLLDDAPETKSKVIEKHETEIDSEHVKQKVQYKFDPWQRMFNYGIQKMKRKKNDISDELDFVLSACYQHNEELFPDMYDVYMHKETWQDYKKERITMKPEKTSQQKREQRIQSEQLEKKKVIKGPIKKKKLKEMIHQKLYENHPLIIGGITEKLHPSSMKLMNSSHHSPQTNAGYVRQDMDGNLFQY